jgi:hypothetical protein
MGVTMTPTLKRFLSRLAEPFSMTFRYFLRLAPGDRVSSLLGILAFAVSIWTISADRRKEIRNARPYLRIDEFFASRAPRIGLIVTNAGPGVAIPDSFELIYQGRSLRSRPDERYEEQWNKFRNPLGIREWTNIGTLEPNVIYAQGGFDILIILAEDKYSADVKEAQRQKLCRTRRLQEVLPALEVVIGYHSVHDEKFQIRKPYRGRPTFYRPPWYERLPLIPERSFVEWQP